MEYSSFLVMQQKQKEPTAEEKDEKEREEENSDTVDSPLTNEGDNQRLLDALSRSRGQQQRGVLSFKTTTPKLSGSRELIVCHRSLVLSQLILI